MGNMPNLRSELKKRVWNRAGYIRGRERSSIFSRKKDDNNNSPGELSDTPLPLSNIHNFPVTGNSRGMGILRGMGSRPCSISSSISNASATDFDTYSNCSHSNNDNNSNTASPEPSHKGKEVKACGCRRYCNKYGVMAECMCRVAASYFRRCW